MSIDIPKVITQTLYVTVDTIGYGAGEINITDYDRSEEYWVEKYGTLLLKEFEVELDIPEIDTQEIKQRMVVNLQGQITKIKAVAQQEIQGLQDQINDLLALPAPEVHFDMEEDVKSNGN